ncbi:MAG TPA: flagellar biosynthetic protein FliO [Syntrophales bacterium]|nr:flagellar biosynthetic protein FliO [Syntrophales bacterium]HOM06900.1 flagellar biosynthetic protein FliO [Syntrophales bacterium]HON99417.1 flagellar biosynthetic protein FliO [Syntrophales bacterium]HPC00546.1 flagellar biosynthetic protein FliO [Syntrophales bacterium]HPQ06441.1 flagellar biosynthetic protein FliO [Syntrophales bacterium]
MEPSYLTSFLKMLFALALVLGIMVGAVYLLKRLTGQTGPGLGEGIGIDVVSARPMGPKGAVMILRVLDRVLVVGVTDQAINLLAEIADEKGLERLRRETVNSSTPAGLRPSPLLDLFKGLKGRWGR